MKMSMRRANTKHQCRTQLLEIDLFILVRTVQESEHCMASARKSTSALETRTIELLMHRVEILNHWSAVRDAQGVFLVQLAEIPHQRRNACGSTWDTRRAC